MHPTKTQSRSSLVHNILIYIFFFALSGSLMYFFGIFREPYLDENGGLSDRGAVIAYGGLVAACTLASTAHFFNSHRAWCRPACLAIFPLVILYCVLSALLSLSILALAVVPLVLSSGVSNRAHWTAGSVEVHSVGISATAWMMGAFGVLLVGAGSLVCYAKLCEKGAAFLERRGIPGEELLPVAMFVAALVCLGALSGGVAFLETHR